MKKSTLIWTVIVIVILIIIGTIVFNNNNNTSTPVSNSSAPMIPAPAPATTVLNTGTSASLGTFLVATNGMTLYQYSKDTPGISNCTGGCATAWPPYTASASTPLTGGTGVNGSISTIARADGTMQVTYNGMPLYFFQSDSKPGDAAGQNVNGFSVVKP